LTPHNYVNPFIFQMLATIWLGVKVRRRFTDGKHHRASLPQGLVSSDAVGKLRSRAKREVHPKLAELVAATRDPFMQTIVDVTVTGTVFGRVMLVGDAAFVVRPHTAGAAAKAAYDAWVLSKSLASARQNVDAGLKAAESLQMEQGQSLVQYGVALGDRWAKGSLALERSVRGGR
jgi:2-polyprenyl-6-methoxyphenol hydroxylase-like FAD-dependent oxidoreductase